MNKNLILIIIICFFSISPAFAAGGYLNKMDQNKDGRVSRQESLNWAGGVFDKLDKNGDGSLKPDELEQLDKSKREQFLQAADLDQDGVILKEEFEKAVRNRFSSMDKNGDGYIDKKERRSSLSEKNAKGFILFTF